MTMGQPPSNQAEIDAGNRFASWRRGWMDRSRGRDLDPRFVLHKNQDLFDQYLKGFREADQAASVALRAAAEAYGVDLENEIIRIAQQEQAGQKIREIVDGIAKELAK